MIEKNTMLKYLNRPGFCVENGSITQLIAAAAALLLTPGMEVAPLLLSGREELQAFDRGCLYLKLNLAPGGLDAFVTDLDGQLLFVVDSAPDMDLPSLALASRELRVPLSGMMVSASRMKDHGADTQDDFNRLTRSLHQTLRLVGNMSDACHIPDPSRQQMVNLTALFDEVFDKAQSAVASAGLELTWQSLNKDVFSLADSDQLERAVLNILSNAMKFTPKGGQIRASLTLNRQTLRLQIADTGCGIPADVRATLFHRYQRQPGIEDSRFGLGLGMVIIRNAAACHGGTVLVDHPRGGGTRVTMTLALRKPQAGSLRSPRVRMDYAGEWNHLLVELSDVLPPECFQKEL